MQTKQQRISIDNLLLDGENPRIQAEMPYAKESIDVEKQQLTLMYLLICHDDVKSLIEDMLESIVIANEMLENDIILLQQIEGTEKYIVKEGNRRICALKVLKDLSLLDEVSEQIYALGYTDEEKKSFNKFKVRLFKRREEIQELSSIENKIFSPKCKVYGLDEISTNILNAILRRMHVYQKRAWRSQNKQIFEYNRVMIEMKNGAKSISAAITNALLHDEEGNVTSNQKANLKKWFHHSNFYQYLLTRIGDGFFGTEIDKLANDIKNRSLVYSQTLATRLSADYQISLSYGADTYNKELNIFEYKLLQKDGLIKISDVESFVDELVKEIFDKKYINTDFAKPADFKERFRDIISKYTITGQDKKIRSYTLFKGKSNTDIDSALELAESIFYNDQQVDKFDKNLVGDWKIIINPMNELHVTVQALKTPAIKQSVEDCITHKSYAMDELFVLINSYDEEGGAGVRPKRDPIILPAEQSLYNKKRSSITFRNPGVYTINLEMFDKNSELSCSHEFTIFVKDYVRPRPESDLTATTPSYIASYFNKTKLDIKADVMQFIVEINAAMEDESITMIYIASFRSLVELVCQDIVKCLGKNFEKESLGPTYKAIMKHALVSDNFLEIVKNSSKYTKENYKTLKSFYGDIVNDLDKDGFINFLNLSTHQPNRFADKDMVTKRKKFIEYLINYLDFLNSEGMKSDDVKELVGAK